MARSSGWMRTLDRVGGAVAVSALGLRHRRRLLPPDPQKVGVIIPTAIGDTILGSGLFEAIAHRYPRAGIVAFHGATNAAAVRLIPGNITFVQCPFTNAVRTVRLLRAARCDLMVDLTPWTKLTAIYARLAAPVAVGFDLPGQRRGAAFDIAVRHRGDVHELDNHAAMAALFSDRRYRMNIVPEPLPPLPGLDLRRLVLCHPSAGGARAADKSWPVACWAELARRLVASGWQVGVTGAPGDASLVNEILTAAALDPTQAVSLCGKVTLGQLGALVEQVRLLVTIDTGVLHLAAAVDGNVLAIHGPTMSSRWGARSRNAASLDSDHPAAGYICYGYETHPRGAETMLSHKADEVVRTALAKLGAPGPRI